MVDEKGEGGGRGMSSGMFNSSSVIGERISEGIHPSFPSISTYHLSIENTRALK